MLQIWRRRRWTKSLLMGRIAQLKTSDHTKLSCKRVLKGKLVHAPDVAAHRKGNT